MVKRPLISAAFLLQCFSKANNAVGFCEAKIPVEGKALGIGQFTVAGKFPAALFLCPDFTGGQEQSGIAVSAAVFGYKNPFQITNRGGSCSFHIVMAKLALGKANRPFLRESQKYGTF